MWKHPVQWLSQNICLALNDRPNFLPRECRAVAGFGVPIALSRIMKVLDITQNFTSILHKCTLCLNLECEGAREKQQAKVMKGRLTPGNNMKDWDSSG